MTLSLAEDYTASVTDELMRKKHWWHKWQGPT